MGSGKGGGSAKGGGGKGGGEVEAMPQGSGRGGMMGGNGSSAAAAPARYNPQQDFYGSGNMVNQPLSGYYQTYPAPGGNNYAPPPAPVETAPETPATDPNDPLAGMSPAARAALGGSMFNSGYMGMTSPFGNSSGYNPSFLPSSGGSRGAGNEYNPSFLPNQNVFGSTLLNPNYYR